MKFITNIITVIFLYLKEDKLRFFDTEAYKVKHDKPIDVAEGVIIIQRKNYPCLVIPTKVSNLDKTKCSHKFLQLNLSEDEIVYVKCYHDGSFDLRGKKGEYRILKKDLVVT